MFFTALYSPVLQAHIAFDLLTDQKAKLQFPAEQKPRVPFEFPSSSFEAIPAIHVKDGDLTDTG